jgi:hypothetical protein
LRNRIGVSGFIFDGQNIFEIMITLDIDEKGTGLGCSLIV